MLETWTSGQFDQRDCAERPHGESDGHVRVVLESDNGGCEHGGRRLRLVVDDAFKASRGCSGSILGPDRATATLPGGIRGVPTSLRFSGGVTRFVRDARCANEFLEPLRASPCVAPLLERDCAVLIVLRTIADPLVSERVRDRSLERGRRERVQQLNNLLNRVGEP